jgi:integrase
MLYQRGKGKVFQQKNGKQRTERTWWYRFRFGGRIVHESSKSTSKEVAREAERQRRRQLEETYNGIKKRELPPTFEKASADWLMSRQGRVAVNTMNIARVALKHVLPAFGNNLLSDVTAKDIQSYQQDRLKDGAQGRTINIEVQTLRQVLRANKYWKHLEGEIHGLKERKDVGRALTPEEESLLLAECAKIATGSACYAAVTLAINTAMRSDEIKHLRWSKVDLFERILTVGKSKTDAGTGRVIPLNPAAVKALADWGNRFPGHKPEHYVFPQAEGNTPPDPTRPARGWRTAWRTATRSIECPECGWRQNPADTCRNPECKADIRGLKNPLSGLRFHDLRHCAISKMAEGQASDQVIMSISGHVSRAMLEHYSHVRLAAKRVAVDAISTPLPEPSTPSKGAHFPTGVHQNGNQIGLHQNEAVGKLLN